ncbi:isochorismatase family protein [Micromonospora sp. ATA32]|nr:isochorismatase family protein [Micromonospora sp. ATA32]
MHAGPGTGTVFDPAGGHVRLIEGLNPVEGEPTLVKPAHNAFTTTNLQQLLTSAGIRDLTICGIRTEQCCETTTRIGFDLGYPDAAPAARSDQQAEPGRRGSADRTGGAPGAVGTYPPPPPVGSSRPGSGTPPAVSRAG